MSKHSTKASGANGLQALNRRSSIPQKLLRHAIEVEIFGGRSWRPVVSRDGIACEVGTLRPRALRNDGSGARNA